jgi:hypothetical protein
MECDFIAEDNFGCEKFIFKSWKKVTAKCVANFFVLGSYVATVSTYIF